MRLFWHWFLRKHGDDKVSDVSSRTFWLVSLTLIVTVIGLLVLLLH